MKSISSGAAALWGSALLVTVLSVASASRFGAGWTAPISRIAEAAPTPAATAAPDPSAAPGEDSKVTALAESLISGLQNGNPDRSRLTPTMNAVLTTDRVAALKAQLGPLGAPLRRIYMGKAHVGTFDRYLYRLDWKAVRLDEVLVLDGSGKVAGLFLQRPGQTPLQPAAAPSGAPSSSAPANPSPAAR